MSEEQKTTPTYGYHRTKEPQIFDLAEGESLPRGWADTPAAFEKPEPAEQPAGPLKAAEDVKDAG